MSVIESPALDLRTKICNGCGKDLPWRDYWPREKWPDGTMRVPRSRCKKCDPSSIKQWAIENRERHNAIKLASQHRQLADPEKRAEYNERHRRYNRRRAGITPDRYRFERRAAAVERGHLVTDPRPFLDWLRTLGDDAEQIGAECGIDPAQIRKYLSGAMVPTERTVDRAVTFAEQTYRLEELLPLADTGDN